MILKAEASIDIDANRKIWIELSGKTEPDEDPADVIPVLADNLVSAVIKAHDEVAQRLGLSTPRMKDPLETFED
jgi:hypothetical protein